ncbi:MAG: hypothetical protein KDK39_16405 [Leptospiraceae bacterium]|nr:hypothetical protein [Leptospiraceae bacterium]
MIKQGERSLPASLFTRTGIELEYMIVDRESLAVRPLADRLFRDVGSAVCGEYDNGPIAWSNELVNHVVELKCNTPAPGIHGLSELFAANVSAVNQHLQSWECQLLPGGAHPFMNPATETQLWPQENKEIYKKYDELFNCSGHGWSNLQSMHINLPFAGDPEFGRLHAAVRLLLPILPALAASSPMIENEWDSCHDARLRYYGRNQERVPVIAGRIMPEPVYTKADYESKIFKPIKQAMIKLDPDEILEHQFLNSRGAIARFDRDAIEIRLLDIQECPLMDLSIAIAVIAVLRWLCGHESADEDYNSLADLNLIAAPALAAQQGWSITDLESIYLSIVQQGEDYRIENSAYLSLFGYPGLRASALDLWRWVYAQIVQPQIRCPSDCQLHVILEQGSLSTRIKRRLQMNSMQKKDTIALYRQLAQCLAQNTPYVA